MACFFNTRNQTDMDNNILFISSIERFNDFEEVVRRFYSECLMQMLILQMALMTEARTSFTQ